MLQGKPFLPPAAVPGITARLPGSQLGSGFRMAVEDAGLLQSSFLKSRLAPLDWEEGIQVAETGSVGEGEA